MSGSAAGGAGKSGRAVEVNSVAEIFMLVAEFVDKDASSRRPGEQRAAPQQALDETESSHKCPLMC
jgi:hypothetical protein